MKSDARAVDGVAAPGVFGDRCAQVSAVDCRGGRPEPPAEGQVWLDRRRARWLLRWNQRHLDHS